LGGVSLKRVGLGEDHLYDSPNSLVEGPMLTTLNRRAMLQLSGAAFLTACSRSKPEEASLADLPVMPPKDSAAPAASRPDGVRLIQIDGKHNVWTKKIGNGAIKVLTLHGGPGESHAYLECFEKFLPQAGIEFYYYDQLGCGFSDKPEDSSLWTMDRYREEVEQVRGGLGLENFVLYGHAFGAALAMEYALKYPTQIRRLVLSNMTASSLSYETYLHQLRSTMAPDILAKMEQYEKAGQFEDPRYVEMVQQFLFAKNRCRLDPLPEPVRRTFKEMNRSIYNTMHGPNEFLVTGNMKEWNRWSDLMRINLPTLTIGSRWDEVDPTEIEKEAHVLERGRYAYCPDGSHMCMWDDQKAYFDQLIPFLKA
jgi:proline iminopeptidase